MQNLAQNMSTSGASTETGNKKMGKFFSSEKFELKGAMKAQGNNMFGCEKRTMKTITTKSPKQLSIVAEES